MLLPKLLPLPQSYLESPHPPIVFMHGFGLLGSLRRNGMFDPIVHALRKRGLAAYAPNVTPYQTIEVRAQQWAEAFAQLTEKHPHHKFHVIAHSMGGLDARYLISRLEGAAYIQSLTTIASPHHGSFLATYSLNQPKWLREPMLSVMNSLGNKAFEHAPSNVAEALEQLTPDFVVQHFNPNTPDHPDVAYYSFSAKAGKGTDYVIIPSMWLGNRILFDAEGLNDGLVSVKSAMWTGHQAVLLADHAAQIGIRKQSFLANQFYESWIKTQLLKLPSVASM